MAHGQAPAHHLPAWLPAGWPSVSLSLVLLGALACSDDSSAVDASSADAFIALDGAIVLDGSGDGSLLDGGVDGRVLADAAMDALDSSAGDASIDLDCLGERRALVLSHGLPYAPIQVGGEEGLFLLDLATTRSAIDLSAFSRAPVASGCDPSRLGQSCSFSSFDFFGPWGSVTLTTQDFRGLGGVSQAGILGTDFFSVLALTFDYDTSEVRRAQPDELCSDAELDAAGLVPLSTEGFYSDQLSRLRPMRDVDESAPAGITVPNVPTIRIRIAGVDAFAQLDTGFDDMLVPQALNVNVALFSAIQAAAPDSVVRDAANDLSLSTCVVGVFENVEAWLVSGDVELLGESGEAATSLADVRLFVKNTPPAASVCGGIGTWTAPAGQLAASLHVALGRIVVDPFSSRVWVPAL